MDKPTGVKQAEVGIWGMIAVAAAISLVNKWNGVISAGEFGINLFLYGLLCILPYKIGRGSNAARYIFAVLTVISILLLLGGDMDITRLDWIFSIIMLPVDAFILFRLFQQDAAEWFDRSRVQH